MPTFRDDTTIEIATRSVPRGWSSVSADATRLLEIFTRGDIEPGTRVRRERQLATTLGVGRSAVREALAALETLGIVTVRSGAGTYLRGHASELLPQTLSWGLALGADQTNELIEVRGALEIYAARSAVTRTSDEALERLGGHVARMRASLDDLPRSSKPTCSSISSSRRASTTMCCSTSCRPSGRC